MEAVGPTGVAESSGSSGKSGLPHSCLLLVGDKQGLLVWGHASLVDEARPVVAGEGEVDSWAHSTP